MSALSLDESQPSPYDSEPLQPNEIRLLTVEVTSIPSLQHVFPWSQPATTLSLTTNRYTLDNVPAYDAVSYVWGTAKESISVPCNGSHLQLTRNAYEMLKCFRSHGREIWVDQVSINQSDVDEKTTHIPSMRAIYARADSVVIWLGKSNAAIDLFWHEFPTLTTVAKQPDLDPWSTEPNAQGLYWPRIDDMVWVGLYHILSNKWFTRLWTFQEVVLAQQAYLLTASDTLQTTRVNALQFSDFVSRGHFMVDLDATNGSYLIYNYMAAERLHNRPTVTQLAFRACDTIMRGRESRRDNDSAVRLTEMPILMGDLLSLDVKEPVDRIWAIAGLLSEEIQEQLAPSTDYSDKGRREYWRAYLAFAKVVIEKGPSLNILEFPITLNRSPHLPSWCPDLSHKPAYRMYLDDGWNRRITDFNLLSSPDPSDKYDDKGSYDRYAAIDSHPAKSFRVDEHNALLHVTGFRLDTIAHVVSFPHVPQGLEAPDTMRDLCNWLQVDPLRTHITTFYREALQLARSLHCASSLDAHGIPEDYLRAFFADDRVASTDGTAYREAWMTLTTGGFAYFAALDTHTKEAVKPYLSRFWRVLGHVFFATQGGRMGLGAAGFAAGDSVCAFYGGEPLYVVRGDGRVRFVGVGFLPGVMEQGQREGGRVGEVREFVVG